MFKKIIVILLIMSTFSYNTVVAINLNQGNEVNYKFLGETEQSDKSERIVGNNDIRKRDLKDAQKEVESDQEENQDYGQITIGEKYLTEDISIMYSQENLDFYLKSENDRKFFESDIEGQRTSRKLISKTNNKYEIAIAHSSGDFSFVKGIDNKDLAINIIKSNTLRLSSDDMLVILEKGQVIYAEQAMGRLIKHEDNIISNVGKTTDLYQDSLLKNVFTYYNHSYIDDVPVLEIENNSIKVTVSGYDGWVKNDIISGNYEVKIVPLNQVKNPSYYINVNGELRHFISSDLLTSGKGNTLKLGKAPSFMNKNEKYYSYDGIYFYKTLSTLLNDAKSGRKNNSVNFNNPFYNYYLSLPFRSQSEFSAKEIDKFILENTAINSKLRGVGKYLIDAQNKYGVNALLMLGIAINESGWGVSNIALNKNNIFGLNAIDSSPGESSNYFSSIKQCIDEFAKYWISKGYANPSDWRYFGALLGNKSIGANVKYASDPFWGEKAAQYFYKADYHISGGINNLRDYDRYQLAIFNKSNEVIDDNNNLIYKIDSLNSSKTGKIGAMTILKKKDIVQINNRNYYKIVLDRTTPISSGEFLGNYDWNKSGYVKTEGIKLVNKGKKFDNNEVGEWKKINEYWYFYNSNGQPIKGWLENKGYKYYLDKNTGIMQTGWELIENKYYYFGPNGEMKTGWINDGWTDYYLKKDGTIYKGLLDDGMYKYYMDENGEVRRGWVKINNEYYYFGKNGEMKTGWINDGWTDYYLKKDGTIYKGFLDDGMYKYYMDQNGEMRKGWVKINGKFYYFGPNGEMKTGWIKDNNTWYYMDRNGQMVTNKVIDGWKINSDGVAIKL